MKIKAKKELHEKIIPELKTALREAHEEIFSLKLQKAQKKLKNVRMLFEKRKDIARIQTILREKELENANI